MSWLELLCEALGRDDLLPVGATVPFGLRADLEVSWLEPRLTRRGDRGWELMAGSPQGLEAIWRVREHPGARALECSGTLRNASSGTIKGVRELRTLDLPVGLSEAWGQPLVRMFNGVRQQIASSFPPEDFRFRDRRLTRMPQVHSPLQAIACDDGFSSGLDLPCAILAGEAGDRGLAMFYEWSGLWAIGIRQAASPAGAVTWPWALRLRAGVWGLALDLRPGEELPLPNLLLMGFDGNLDDGGNALRRHIARHVAPTLGGAPPLPPVSFNHWFSLGNDFTAASLEPAVSACAAAGVEYFVVDAGWFPGGFRQGIGNWSEADSAKFPKGISGFARHLRERDLKLGLWFEPEFAHIESELHRAHPDWFLPGPPISPWSRPSDIGYDYEVEGEEYSGDVTGERFRLIDFGRPEARRWWIDRVVAAYERWGVRWIRWDFNQTPRPHWDATALPGRVGINQISHITGFYKVLDEILEACPDLFIEMCASGGFRIDLGTVRRGHAFWMNDQTTNSDIVRAFQHGLNAVLPGIYANTNLCQERFDYDDYDFLSHGGGSFGFSGRLWQAPRADFERCRRAVERFKGYRHLLGGDYRRPTGNPDQLFEAEQVAWSDGEESVEMRFNADGRRRSAEVSWTPDTSAHGT